MKVRVPDYYNKFKCLGDKCPDTCCVGWVIEIDDDAYKRFLSLEGKTGEEIRNNIVINDEGKPCFKLNENGRCAFLNEKNLCRMYIDLGEEAQCALCANYPRIGDEFGSLREMGLSISCPEVARLILNHKEAVSYEEWDIDEKPDTTDYCEDIMFQTVLSLREVAVFIAQNRKYSIHERLGLLIVLGSRMQMAVDENDCEGLEETAYDFSDEKYLEKVIASFNKAADKTYKEQFINMIYTFLERLDYISPKWVNLVNEARQADTKGAFCEEYRYENFLVYLILRYFMKVIFDGEIYSKCAFMAFSVLLTEELVSKQKASEDRIIDIFYLFSKEIEHCEENMAMLNDWFWEEPWNNPKNIIDVLTTI